MTQINEEVVRKVLSIVDAGLTHGLGTPEPGKMCVEAAVCFALDQPHGDQPSCVHPVVRNFKIALNDSAWSSNKARAKGLRRIAIAQLGSTNIDAVKFASYVAEHTIRRIVPIALESAAKLNPKFAESLLAAAKQCKDEGTESAAWSAESAARSAESLAAWSAELAAWSAASAARSAASSAAWSAESSAAWSAASSARSAASSARSAASSAAWSAASSARSAASSAAWSAASKDEVLTLCAEIGVEALIACQSEGVKFLGLTK